MDSIHYRYQLQLSSSKPGVFCDLKSTNAKKILSTDNFLKVLDAPWNADLIWIREHDKDLENNLKPFQALNYIPKEGSMTQKGDLSNNLKCYNQSHPEIKFSYQHFHPATYRLYNPQEKEAFLKQLPKKDHPDNLWILKPTSLSQGEGVKILWRFDQLKKELSIPQKRTLEYQGEQLEYIIQRYIKNVFLLDGRKSELRVYWLIASLDPLLVLMYKEGTARLTSEPYKLDDFDNPLIHITNIYQQKKNSSDPNQNLVLKWNFSRLQDYLCEKKSVPTDYLEKTLKSRFKQCLAYVVLSSLSSLKQHPNSGHFFGLYGADFILDDNLTPWLTEIQRAPGLSYNDPVKKEIIPPMLIETIHIILEIQNRVRHMEPLRNLSSVKNFEWIINPLL